MNQIINILKKKKSIALDQFIDIALYDKKNGYYMKKNPFGKKGDFVTAPLISNLFGEMIAVWCVAFWENLKKPKKILIVELGPGDGTLCNDLLNSFKNFKNFYNSVEINLLEKSNKLKKIQKKKIHNKKVKWIKKLEEVNFGPVIFIGNEFFDSLPIKQLHKNKNLFFEKHISLSKNKKKIKFIYKKAKEKLIKNVQNFKLASESGIIEFPGESIKYLEIISKLIKKFNGGLLILDYGYTQKTNGNSLQSVKDHKYKDVFLDPGNADITSHVNYQLFFNILRNKQLCVKKVVTQNEFLQKLGIIERANILAKKMSFNAKIDMFYRLKKLLDNKKMGHLFKVLFAQKRGGEIFFRFLVMFFSNRLKKFKNLNHCFFSRKNGVSDGYYKSLNCGLGSNDSKINVLQNLKLVSQKINCKKKLLITLNQKHSNKVIYFKNKKSIKNKLSGDAIVTKLKNVGIGILTADCAPILLYDPKKKIIGCIHSGWKGAINGVIKNTIKKFNELGSKNNNLIAVVGPCIKKKNYEVKNDFYEKFIYQNKKNEVFFDKLNNNKYIFDLRNFINEELSNFDINYIENIEIDTFSNPKIFYSFRRSCFKKEKDYGRCISVILMT